jgi:hypothetical protein
MVKQVWSKQLGYLTTLALLQNWVVGRWHSAKEQAFAPPGTHFNQFVVPLLTPARKDCTYSQQVSIRLPKVRSSIANKTSL